MSISEDLTIAERAVLKEWVDKAKSRNQGLPTNSNSIFGESVAIQKTDTA